MENTKRSTKNPCGFSGFSGFRYTLDKSSKKFYCPRCNKRRLVRYIDTTTGEYLSDEYGRCDREGSCQYWLKPEAPAREIQPAHTIPILKKVFIPVEVYKASRKAYDHNSFVNYLLTLFDQETVADLIKRYAIGTSKYFPGACVFWFLDQFGNVVAGQIKPFDKSGHTVKDEQGEALVNWAHHVLRSQAWAKEYNQQDRKITCLFGEHLLRANPGKPIAICESPKTAIIATPYFPKFLWLAAGALSWLTPDKLKILKGRKVILFPDLKAYDRWKEKGDAFGFTTSDILERSATEGQRAEGLDLADFLEDIPLKDFLKRDVQPECKNETVSHSEPYYETLKDGREILMHPVGYPMSWAPEPKTALDRMTEKHPMVSELIKRLDLIEV